MNNKVPLSKAAIGLVLTCALSTAVGDRTDLCPDEKSACCGLDWTGQGATIVKVVGEAMVSQSPWINATVGMRVHNGGRVMALEGSTVVVAFDDGCWHEVKENQILTVEDVSPCCPAVAKPPLLPAAPPPAPKLNWFAPGFGAVGAGILAGILNDLDDSRDDDGFVPPPPISR